MRKWSSWKAPGRSEQVLGSSGGLEGRLLGGEAAVGETEGTVEEMNEGINNLENTEIGGDGGDT